MPRSSREPGSQLSEFQPTCGDLTLSGKRPHAPENNPKPRVPGASVLDSNIDCIPTQTPRNGAPCSILRRIAVRSPVCSKIVVDEKWPTPGRTILSARATTPGSLVTTVLAPR